MSHPEELSSSRFVLPASVVSKVDLRRLVNELEQIDNYLVSVEARQKVGAVASQQPAMSEQLRDLVSVNSLNLSSSQERSSLIRQIREFKDKAPTIHMTFASTADQESLRLLANWVRAEIHPQAVISIGLQPGLLGGVHLRTTNQIHDLSLRSQLSGKRHLLVKQLEALGG